MSGPDREFDRFGSEYIAADLLTKTGWIVGRECRERIVRCRDCRHWATERRFTFGCVGKSGKPDPDGYCAWGERRES